MDPSALYILYIYHIYTPKDNNIGPLAPLIADFNLYGKQETLRIFRYLGQRVKEGNEDFSAFR